MQFPSEVGGQVLLRRVDSNADNIDTDNSSGIDCWMLCVRLHDMRNEEEDSLDAEYYRYT